VNVGTVTGSFDRQKDVLWTEIGHSASHWAEVIAQPATLARIYSPAQSGCAASWIGVSLVSGDRAEVIFYLGRSHNLGQYLTQELETVAMRAELLAIFLIHKPYLLQSQNTRTVIVQRFCHLNCSTEMSP
jgi:hypothetical protein